MIRCQLIVGAGQPAYNMAFDEWMLSKVIHEPRTLLVRLYSWSEGCLTIGVNQREDRALDFTKLGDTPVIRRVTGGRALYHDISELTYSIAFNTEKPPLDALRGSLRETSELIALALQEFLSLKGVNSEWVRRSKPSEGRPEFFHKAPCFQSAAKYELLSEGQKVIASAQRRYRSGLLQHGSIKLSKAVAHPALDSTASPVSGTKAIEEEQLAQNGQFFGRAFSNICRVDLHCADLTSEEQNLIFKYSELVNEFRLERRLNLEQTRGPLGLLDK